MVGHAIDRGGQKNSKNTPSRFVRKSTGQCFDILVLIWSRIQTSVQIFENFDLCPTQIELARMEDVNYYTILVLPQKIIPMQTRVQPTGPNTTQHNHTWPQGCIAANSLVEVDN